MNFKLSRKFSLSNYVIIYWCSNMKREALKKIIVALANHKEVIVASSIALAGITFIILGDPWDTDNPWL